MAIIALTDADFSDIFDNEYSINAMDDDGNEHPLEPEDFEDGDKDFLLSGGEVFVGNHRVSYPE